MVESPDMSQALGAAERESASLPSQRRASSASWSARLPYWVAGTGSSPRVPGAPPPRLSVCRALDALPVEALANPTPALIRQVRMEAGLSQLDAARSVGCSHAARWGEYEAGTVRMTICKWELFLLKTGRHPLVVLRKRRPSEASQHPC